MASHLEALAKRVESDPFFLASALKDYAQSEGLDELGLATVLGCTKETLDLLRLCRMPDPERFKVDVDQIAARFHVHRDALAQAVRRGQVLLHLRQDTPSDRGMLLAARDGDEEAPDQKSGSSP